jgi:hypothetical protein
VACVAQGEVRLAHKVVLDLAVNVQWKRHVIRMHNFFTSVGLLQDLALMQIYTTWTVRSNRIGLPLTLKNRGAFRNAPQGTLD